MQSPRSKCCKNVKGKVNLSNVGSVRKINPTNRIDGYIREPDGPTRLKLCPGRDNEGVGGSDYLLLRRICTYCFVLMAHVGSVGGGSNQ